MPILYHNNIAVCGARVRLVLAEKKIKWTGRIVELAPEEKFAPEFMTVAPEFTRHNPKCEVTALVHDGHTIRDSRLINEYLDDAFPDPPSRPSSAYGRLYMRSWCRAPDEGLHLACAIISFVAYYRHQVLAMRTAERNAFFARAKEPYVRKHKRAAVLRGFEAPFVQDAIELYEKVFDKMEERLREAPWLAGESYSLADATLTSYVNRLAMFGFLDRRWKLRPHLTAWFDRVRERPNFKAAVLDWIGPDLTAELLERGATCRPEYEAALAAA